MNNVYSKRKWFASRLLIVSTTNLKSTETWRGRSYSQHNRRHTQMLWGDYGRCYKPGKCTGRAGKGSKKCWKRQKYFHVAIRKERESRKLMEWKIQNLFGYYLGQPRRSYSQPKLCGMYHTTSRRIWSRKNGIWGCFWATLGNVRSLNIFPGSKWL